MPFARHAQPQGGPLAYFILVALPLLGYLFVAALITCSLASDCWEHVCPSSLSSARRHLRSLVFESLYLVAVCALFMSLLFGCVRYDAVPVLPWLLMVLAIPLLRLRVAALVSFLGYPPAAVTSVGFTRSFFLVGVLGSLPAFSLACYLAFRPIIVD